MTLRELEADLSSPAAEHRTQPVASPASRASGAVPLALREITKRWRKDQPPVLDELELTLEPGTATWVGGRNGAGKTTMLRIAAGLIEPEQGRTEVWGVTARENRTRYHTLLSFLPAGDRGLYARLTVRRQLVFWARIAMVPKARFEAAIEDAIQAFELRELEDCRVDRISMGQRQRLRLAMTFLAGPEIVLLDEPLTSLDGEGAALLQQAISELLARDGALLWCSPSGEQLDMSFDTRWELDSGRLVRA
ncbi:MAG TPA: ABC transporter ATP-binding protein [Solirubrobacteraceae bacterium]|nr:ABC transporter ATP-binding protein [Solirubrobacteraceae bacterium]